MHLKVPDERKIRRYTFSTNNTIPSSPTIPLPYSVTNQKRRDGSKAVRSFVSVISLHPSRPVHVHVPKKAHVIITISLTFSYLCHSLRSTEYSTAHPKVRSAEIPAVPSGITKYLPLIPFLPYCISFFHVLYVLYHIIIIIIAILFYLFT